MYSKKCSKCDSTLIKARIQSSPGTVGVNKTPSSILNNNHNYSELIPYVCSSCSYVDFLCGGAWKVCLIELLGLFVFEYIMIRY
ncbi:hypothetical protein BACILLUS_001701 [Priestia megaterium]|jgi:hypothetical protein